MKPDQKPMAMLALKWTLGLVILAQATRFAFSPAAAQTFAKTGMPDVAHLALAWGEMAAAVLFLIPRATVAGGWFLITILGFAIVVHLLHGWFDVGALVVDAAATWAVMAASSAAKP
jgi:uncharacterized membrane protein YphA (DoxX/SURF4 family)